MNGYKLTEKMRQARRRCRFTATEQALFYELVAVCNGENWSDVFDCSNMELCLALSINEKTLIKARESLINAQLIYYKSGKSKRTISRYSFTQSLKRTTVNNTADDTTHRTVASTSDNTAKSTDLYKQETQILNLSIEKAFEEFRKLYPGSKRGFKTEYANFRRHADYRQTVHLLQPALQKLMEWNNRAIRSGQFVPAYANMHTWINQRRWETELATNNNAHHDDHNEQSTHQNNDIQFAGINILG